MWWAETEGFVGSHRHGDFERSLKQIKPVTHGYGYGFFGGTKVCTRTRTPELPVTLPAGISVPVTFPMRDAIERLTVSFFLSN